MNWRETGILLAMRPYGESSAIIYAMTENNGRHSGIVLGAYSRRLMAVLQPGNQLSLEWRARLADHLGNFRVELETSRSVQAFSGKLALGGYASVCALLQSLLPEREPYPELYRSTVALLDRVGADDDWLPQYLRWELQLLKEIGFGLDIERCVVTGSTIDLVFVSPRSGRAVSRQGAGKWADKLLPLPGCLKTGKFGDPHEMADGMRTIGYFLGKGLESISGSSKLPSARTRFFDSIQMATAAD